MLSLLLTVGLIDSSGGGLDREPLQRMSELTPVILYSEVTKEIENLLSARCRALVINSRLILCYAYNKSFGITKLLETSSLTSTSTNMQPELIKPTLG